ncbi:bag of marbles [Cochliomyia hominivorax]
MSSIECNFEEAPDMLQENMENISKELNDLIVTGEQEFAMTQQVPIIPIAAATHLVKPRDASNNYYPSVAYKTNVLQEHQFIPARNVIPNMKHNLNYLMTPLPLAGANNMCPTIYTPTNFFASVPSSTSLHYPLGSSQNLYADSSSPTYEFYYLRSNGENEKKPNSLNTSGCTRKVWRNGGMPYKNVQHKSQNINTKNDDIKIDLSAIDLLPNRKDNTVYYLFELLRDLHRALAEKPPSFDTNSLSQFEETFAPGSIETSTMLSTLNIQNQIKQASRKLMIFICEMQHLLNVNKMFEPQMHSECEFNLNYLHQYMNQLEMYKRIEMEHKRGQFLREEVKVHAERLTILLEHINRQIREVHIRIVAYDWYIGVKYRGDVQYATASGLNNKHEISKKSQIGVINEILQMCNNKLTINPTKLTTNENTSITTLQQQQQQETAAARKPEMKSKSPTNMMMMYNEENIMNMKSLLNKNNVFMTYKPEQAGRAATALANIPNNHHIRQPVFYIG